MDHIDKELDISNILKKLRTLNYFMKMNLDSEERMLLKMRNIKFINSDEEYQ